MTMSRSKRRAAAVLLLGLLAAAAAGGGSRAAHAQQMPEAQAAAVRKGVQATLDAYREHAAAGRWDELMRLYADDPRFRWVSSGIVEARSVEQIRKHFAALPPSARVETTYQDAEITPLAPGIATVTTLFQTRLVDPQGSGFSFGGALTLTMVERPDGWKILGGHSSGTVRRDR
jgi:ketosteroid isomerase-like protein